MRYALAAELYNIVIVVLINLFDVAGTLLRIRTGMEEDFRSATCHKTLWHKIITQLTSEGIAAHAIKP